ncbi:hypothetical protein SAMN04488498_1761 [Mesorhizobium albiziae]|uniref:Uncharacterized protein n=1 Tax=Neomesorhizobium albiziae TaxID=335020 RepID=A0A1I4G4B2_9HYPH|nr:hypothetical protein GCM10007937_58280 [Mesorhizobium albiziae]SFL23911.1 hypothetical protein SAMN04488498_1761 [Mesorhizobium albiziae]
MTGYEKSPDYGGRPMKPWEPVLWIAVSIALAILSCMFFA